MKYYLMIDIGASSGRHMLGHMEDGKIVYEEIHRFTMAQGIWKWHYGVLFHDIIDGMIKCREAGKIPVSMGIDTFGVEPCYLGKYGDPLEVGAMLRDNLGMQAAFSEKRFSFMDSREMYERTGCPDMAGNFIYQMLFAKEKYPSMYDKIAKVLTMPDFLNYLLTGEIKSEYSFATTSGLVSLATNNWDSEVIEAAGIAPEMFVDLTMPGTFVGRLKPELRERVGYDIDVLQVASHDSASANISAPVRDDDSILISSGTWSIVGAESYTPMTTDKSFKYGIHNEGNMGLRHRILKNMTGTIMMQRVRRDYGERYSYDDLENMAKEAADFPSRVDVVNRSLTFSDNTMEEIVRGYCRETSQPVPETLPDVLKCIYQSMAAGYKEIISALEDCFGKKFTSINLFSGGSKDMYLNQLTANATGIPVYAGPTEAATVGNMLVQMIYDGTLGGLAEAKELVGRSFEIKLIEPEN